MKAEKAKGEQEAKVQEGGRMVGIHGNIWRDMATITMHGMEVCACKAKVSTKLRRRRRAECHVLEAVREDLSHEEMHA